MWEEAARDRLACLSTDLTITHTNLVVKYLTKCFLWTIIYFDELSRSQATNRGGSHAAEIAGMEPNGANFSRPRGMNPRAERIKPLRGWFLARRTLFF